MNIGAVLYRVTKIILIDWLIDWIEFYAVSVIFQPYNGGEYSLNLISFEIFLAARTSLLFIEIQYKYKCKM